MKRKQLTILLALVATALYAQVGINTNSPHESAIMDVYSTEKGFLPPRLTNGQKDAIASPAKALVIYNVEEKCLEVNLGDATTPNWTCLNGNANGGNVTVVPDLPTTIVLDQDITSFVASAFDNDYLPYTPSEQPSGDGETDAISPDGTPDTLIDIDGVITEAGRTIIIPVTTTGSDTLPAYSTTINVPANFTEDGIARDVTFSWEEQAYVDGDTTITATIKSVGGPLNVKKLDLNRGLGTSSLGILLADFTYPYNGNGDLSNLALRGVPALADRNFDNPTHRFLYLPVQSASGKVWLNNNLGANYANLNGPAFAIDQQATAINDTDAYGSYYNLGRFSDGHEFESSPTTSTRFPTNRPNSNVGVFNRSFWDDNNQPQTLGDLWATEDAQNNPCPVGFRPPNTAELEEERDVWAPSSGSGAFASPLKLTAAGRKVFNGSIVSPGVFGYYWGTGRKSASVYDSWIFTASTAGVAGRTVAQSISVRCIQD